MLCDTDLITISHQFICNKVADLLNIPLLSFHTIMLIGSSVNPETRREQSDLDLVAFIADRFIDPSQDFKASLQLSHVTHGNNQLVIPADVKIYTLSSFRKEMYHGSLTRVYAILNAFRIIYAESDDIQQIITDADERLNQCVQLSIKELLKMNISAEMKNLQNYFNDARSVIHSEKIQGNHTLVCLRFFEFLKEFFIQFQVILFAADLQNGINAESIERPVRNLIILKNADGTRLLDFNKYFLDRRVKTQLDQINSIFNSNPLPSTASFDLVFDQMNKGFIDYCGYALNREDSCYEYFAVVKIEV